MSSDPSDFFVLPLLIVLAIGIPVSVWVGGNGGDVTWISDAIYALAKPAIFVGFLLAAGALVMDVT